MQYRRRLRTGAAQQPPGRTPARHGIGGRVPPSTALTAVTAESDTRLVSACLNGDEGAWERLLQRYKRLVCSVPLRYGATADVAADVFQAVCVDLVTELPRLRNPEALKGWLVRVAQHKSLKWKVQSRRHIGWGTAHDAASELADRAPNASQTIDAVQRDQAVRNAVNLLPERSRQLVTLLFFTSPPLPYAEVARRLGLATGSIGFIRGRCLKKIGVALKAQGL